MSPIQLLALVHLLYTLLLVTGDFYSQGVTADVHGCSIHALGPSKSGRDDSGS